MVKIFEFFSNSMLTFKKLSWQQKSHIFLAISDFFGIWRRRGRIYHGRSTKHIHFPYFRNAKKTIIVLNFETLQQHGQNAMLPLLKRIKREESFNWKSNGENPCFGTTDCRVRHACIPWIQRSSNIADLLNPMIFSKLLQFELYFNHF